MVYKVFSGRVGGIFGDLVTVEIDSSPGLPALDMIGLLGSEVREAKERVRVSLKNNGINLPAMRITVNLSPADEHKSGTAFDLPIAIAVLGVFGHIPDFDPAKTLITGELSLDGEVKRIKGAIPIAKMARDKGFRHIMVPLDNVKEASMIRGISVIGVSSLSEAMGLLMKGIDDAYGSPDSKVVFENEEAGDHPDFKDIIGQENAKKAAVIAAAGFHHLLMTGPPGSGKSLIAKCIPGIMPGLDYEACLEISSIYSVAGLLNDKMPFVTRRPFISPHHSASDKSLVGGGPKAGPGLVSLSHGGILFLDEMPEFKRDTLDMLRQPLEDGTITISRTHGNYTYPARFMLVGAMNPCPCGYYPDRNRCTCNAPKIEKYLSHISGPLLDRIDLCVEVPRIDRTTLKLHGITVSSSEDLKSIVSEAVKRQEMRYRNESFKFNSFLPVSLIDKYVSLGESERDYMISTYERLKLSMRSYNKILRVARTIADTEGCEKIKTGHLMMASCYRFPDYIAR